MTLAPATLPLPDVNQRPGASPFSTLPPVLSAAPPEGEEDQEVVVQRWGDVPEVVRLMRRSQPLLLRLDALTPADQQRALDFLCGAAVVLRVDCRRAGTGRYRFAPVHPWPQGQATLPSLSSAAPLSSPAPVFAAPLAA